MYLLWSIKKKKKKQIWSPDWYSVDKQQSKQQGESSHSFKMSSQCTKSYYKLVNFSLTVAPGKLKMKRPFYKDFASIFNC